MSRSVNGLPTSAKIANRRRPGTISRKSSIRLPAVSGAWPDKPVILPPGRGRLATMPLPTGSPAVANTIGITDVACFAAMVGGVLCVRITSTLSRTNSSAISAKRSVRPSPQRYSIATLWPSVQPSARSRCTKAAVKWLISAAVPEAISPMVGSLLACCARTAHGHATAPPSSVMKSRRFTRSPRRRAAEWMSGTQFPSFSRS